MATPDTLVCDLPGQRLDTYLAGMRRDLSRSQLQRLIRQGHVLVNGQQANPSSRLRQGDQVRIRIPEAPPEGIIPEELPFGVVYQDDQLLVIDKPPGLTVHPAPGHPRGTLVNALIARYPEIVAVGAAQRPGLVHRLDADTSGLMVVAKTPMAHENLSRQIKNRSITKVYLALVKGHPDPAKGRIEAPIGRHPRNRQRMGIVPGGRSAITEYQTLTKYKGFALLEVRPQTGRTHQIRVHMSALSHPVAGDAKYGGRVPFLRRQFLHAHRLGFYLPPTQTYREFASPLPPDMEEALRTLEPSS